MARKPKDIAKTEPTASTVDNSPVTETPKVNEHKLAPNEHKLAPNEHVTLSGAIRKDH